jgi:hypothetical protein
VTRSNNPSAHGSHGAVLSRGLHLAARRALVSLQPLIVTVFIFSLAGCGDVKRDNVRHLSAKEISSFVDQLTRAKFKQKNEILEFCNRAQFSCSIFEVDDFERVFIRERFNKDLDSSLVIDLPNSRTMYRFNVIRTISGEFILESDFAYANPYE